MNRTLDYVHAMARFEGYAQEKDDWARGFAEATLVRDDELARDLILRAQGWAWSPLRLHGFLDAHEVFSRNARCTCRCPIHSDTDAPFRIGSN
jgi:hypothetical protein